MQHIEKPIGDVRRSSIVAGPSSFRFTFPVERRDQWICIESTHLNSLLARLCRAWHHAEAPLVTSRASPWPLVSHLDLGGEKHFHFGCTPHENAETIRLLRDFVNSFGTQCQDQDRKCNTEFRVGDHAPHDELHRLCARLMRKHWGLGEAFSLRLYKIALYKPGDFLDWHRDAVHDVRHVGTVEISLESPDLQGGHVLFRDFSMDPDQAEDQDDCVELISFRPSDPFKMYMFYTDCEHRVDVVTKGYRVSLEYEIIKTQSDDYSGGARRTSLVPDKDAEATVKEIVATMLDAHDTKRLRRPALLASHLYPRGVEPHELRGYDKLIYESLAQQQNFTIELMPTCLLTDDELGLSITRCMSLREEEKKSADEEKRHLTLFITPTVVHCMDTLGEAYVDNRDKVDEQLLSADEQEKLNYATLAMILHLK